MPPKLNVDYASPAPPRPVTWKVEIRYTLLGAIVGFVAAAGAVILLFFDSRGFDTMLPFLCPVTSRAIRLLPTDMSYFNLLALIVGAFFEWLLWGLLVDWCRIFAWAINRRSRRRLMSEER